jgi:hypothetical protein
VEDIATYDVDAFKDELVGRVSPHRTAQKILVILHGVMVGAKRKGWITVNPCEDAENVTVKGSDDFNVLTVEQVDAVAREASCDLLRGLFLTALHRPAYGRAPRAALATHRLRRSHRARATRLR